MVNHLCIINARNEKMEGETQFHRACQSIVPLPIATRAAVPVGADGVGDLRGAMRGGNSYMSMCAMGCLSLYDDG